MTDGFAKRTTFVVRDAAAAARFYCTVFGMTVWYDNRLAVDARFPPCAPDGAAAHLVIVRAGDPKIGMLGFLSYETFDAEIDPGFTERSKLRIGESILVFEVPDLERVHERARASGARVVTPPVHWHVPGPSGDRIELFAMSMFDADGIYSEISQSRGQEG